MDTDRLSYTQKIKEYKELLRVKKTAHRQKVLDALHKAKNDPKIFRGKLKSFVSKKHATNTISKEEWFRYFSEVFSANESTSDNYVLGANDEQVHDFDETEEIEQNKTNILWETAERLGLAINLDNSNIIVFRNGDHIASCEKWVYSENVMAVVHQYKYLGIHLSTRLTFSHERCCWYL